MIVAKIPLFFNFLDIISLLFTSEIASAKYSLSYLRSYSDIVPIILESICTPQMPLNYRQ